MSKTKKKITVSAISDVKKATHTPSVTIEWNGLSIDIKTTMSLRDVISIVDAVVNSCFQEDGAYMPELKEFALRAEIVERMSNVSLPRDTEEKYSILYDTDIYKEIIKHINTTQYIDVVSAIDEKIAATLRDNTLAINRRIDEIVSEFEKLEELLSNGLKNISSEDMANLIKTLGSGEIDNNKIIDLYSQLCKAVDD